MSCDDLQLVHLDRAKLSKLKRNAFHVSNHLGMFLASFILMLPQSNHTIPVLFEDQWSFVDQADSVISSETLGAWGNAVPGKIEVGIGRLNTICIPLDGHKDMST
eukprot:394072-Amphidinium_carterae.1